MPRRNLTKWVNVRGKMEWRSETGGYGELQIVRSERTRPFQYLLMTRPFTGNGIVLSGHGSLAAAKKAGEVFARKLRAHKGNPMPAQKRKATPAQLRNLAKGRKKLAAMRKAGTVTTRRRRPTRRNPCVPAAHRNPRANIYSTVRLAAPNDANGNPRRLFLVMKGGEPVGVFDEEYGGKEAITDKKMRDGWQGITIAVSASEYNGWLKTYRDPRLGIKHNPAYGNFMDARNVLKTGRTTNPQKRRLVPSGRRVPQHYIIASIDPRPPNRIVYWGAFGWGPTGKAVIFSSATEARKIAEKKMKRPAAVVKPKTAERLIREALTK